MSEREQGGSARDGRGGDSNEALQNELRREAAEGRDSIGDIGSNRNVTGSSTWETMLDASSSGERDERGEVL